jgi:hypothetical protein
MVSCAPQKIQTLDFRLGQNRKSRAVMMRSALSPEADIGAAGIYEYTPGVTVSLAVHKTTSSAEALALPPHPTAMDHHVLLFILGTRLVR